MSYGTLTFFAQTNGNGSNNIAAGEVVEFFASSSANPDPSTYLGSASFIYAPNSSQNNIQALSLTTTLNVQTYSILCSPQ